MACSVVSLEWFISLKSRPYMAILRTAANGNFYYSPANNVVAINRLYSRMRKHKRAPREDEMFIVFGTEAFP